MARRTRQRFYLTRDTDGEGRVGQTVFDLVHGGQDLCKEGVDFIRAVFEKPIYMGDVYEISFSNVQIRKVK